MEEGDNFYDEFDDAWISLVEFSPCVQVCVLNANPESPVPLPVPPSVQRPNHPWNFQQYFCDTCGGWWHRTDPQGVRWMERKINRLENVVKGWSYVQCETCGGLQWEKDSCPRETFPPTPRSRL